MNFSWGTKETKGAIGLVGSLCFILGFGGAYWFNKDTKISVIAETRETNLLTVATIAVEPVSSYLSQRYYTGTIEAQRTSDLGFEASGNLVEILVEEGDRVSAGQILARLDMSELEVQKQQLIAQQAQAQAKLTELKVGPRQESIDAARARVKDIEQQLELAQLRQQRRQFLVEQGAIAQEELDQESYTVASLASRQQEAESELAELLAGTRSEQIEAQTAVVAQLRAQIEDINIAIDKSSLKAPFDGIIAQRSLDEGVIVSPGQGVLRLVEKSNLEVRVGVPVEIAQQLDPTATYQIEVGGEVYNLQITSILPELDQNTRTVNIILEFPELVNRKIGEIVRLKIEKTIASQGYWLPMTALTRGDRGLWAAYVVIETKQPQVYQVQKRELEILVSQGDRALVRGSLRDGDQIILAGVHRVIPGQLVSLN